RSARVCNSCHSHVGWVQATMFSLMGSQPQTSAAGCRQECAGRRNAQPRRDVARVMTGSRTRSLSGRALLIAALAGGLLAGSARAASSPVFYWANEGNSQGIGRADLDGSGLMSTFINSGFGTIGVAADGRYVYWTLYGSNSIARDTIDGNPANIEKNFITAT